MSILRRRNSPPALSRVNIIWGGEFQIIGVGKPVRLECTWLYVLLDARGAGVWVTRSRQGRYTSAKCKGWKHSILVISSRDPSAMCFFHLDIGKECRSLPLVVEHSWVMFNWPPFQGEKLHIHIVGGHYSSSVPGINTRGEGRVGCTMLAYRLIHGSQSCMSRWSWSGHVFHWSTLNLYHGFILWVQFRLYQIEVFCASCSNKSTWLPVVCIILTYRIL